MSSAGKVLEGTLYTTTEKGYCKQGKTTITLPSQVNYLPVYSRCHELLKWEDHEKEEPKQKIEEVFCSNLTPSQTTSPGLPKEQFKYSLTLLKKSFRIEDQQDELTKTRHKPASPPQDQKYLNDQNQTRTVNNNSENYDEELPSFMIDTKVLSRENKLAYELERQKMQRLALQNQYNKLLKQAMGNRMGSKDRRREHSLENSGRQRERLSEGKLSQIVSPHQRHLKTNIISDDDSDGHDDVTDLPQYSYSSRIRKADYSAKSQRKYYSPEFPDDIYNELANIYDKLAEIDTDIQTREERLRKELYEKQVAAQETQNKKKIQQKQLKYKQMQLKYQKQRKTNSFVMVNYFILFILGLLFTKAFLC